MKICLTKKLFKILFLVFIFNFLFFIPKANAATGIYEKINFQGKLVNSNGTNVSDGNYSVTFTLYDASSGGTNLWDEVQTVAVADGVFQVELGSVDTTISSVDFNSDSLYLGVKVESDSEMTPRIRFTSVPYAFMSKKVNGLTVTNTTGTFTLTSGKTLSVSNSLTFSGTDSTSFAFPSGSGTIVTLDSTGTLTNKTLGATTLSGAITGNSQNITALAGLTINGGGTITSATSGTLGVGTSSNTTGLTFGNSTNTSSITFDVTTAGNFVLRKNGAAFDCSGQTNGGALTTDASGNITCSADDGGAGGSGTLQQAYDTGSAGNQVVTLDSTQDSIVVRNPSSAGSDSSFVFKVEQLNTGISTYGLYVDNQGTGNALRIDDSSGDTTPVIVDADGRLGIGTSSISGTTERLLQVGSLANRGNTATYGEVITKGLTQKLGLTNIKDVFIYDTSLDSDGGRWIEWADTERHSWATESLDDGPSDPCDISTDDRCYVSTFPRKAILVVTSTNLYIFDSSTGTMWMRFDQNASGYALGVDTNNDPSSVTAANGVVYVGTNGSSAGGLYAIDFVNDRMWNYDDTDRSGADKGIGSRNTAITYNTDNNTNFDLATTGTIAGWKTINDVSVAVVQNSQTAISSVQGPNNATTLVGLATDSGLTVINLSTQKIRQYSDATDNDYNSVVVTRNARLYGLNSTLDQLELWVNIDVDNTATRVNGAPDKLIDETTAPRLSKNTPVVNTGAPDALEVVPNGSLADGGILATATVASNSDLIYVGTDQGLTEIHLYNYSNAVTFSGWSKFFTTSQQTAMMPGMVRRMHGMDDASGTTSIANAAQTDVMAAKGSPTFGVSGVRGTAVSLNGTSQYFCSDSDSNGTCENDTSDNINTGGFSFTVWFKHSTSITGTDVLFARCYNTTPAVATGCIAAAMNSSGQIVTTVDDDALWTIGAATNNDVTYTSTNSYADNQWHFYSLTKYTGNVAPVAMIDGQVISYATALNHATLDNAQILGIGTDCSSGAACGTGGNFWEGAIDEFTFSACGTAACTTDGLSPTAANAAAVGRLLYNDARPVLNKRYYNGASDTVTYTSTTIQVGTTPWFAQEFAGQLVTITSGSGVNQTRRITSNTTNTLTVSPAFTTTPASNDDFKIDPESLVGNSNNVTAIAVTKFVPFGESRLMCAGTNNGTDGGAVTCYNHQAGPNLVADAYHSDAMYLDDNGAEWTGTDYDDIQSIDLTSRTLIIGTMAHTWTETQDVRLGNALDYLQGKFTDIRNQIQTMGTTTLAGQIGLGVGLTGGADLAEYYFSSENLKPGEIIALDNSSNDFVKKTSKVYQEDTLGVVATEPGIVMGGEAADNKFPVALVGRVPVKVTNEGGEIKAGDRITTSSTAGYGMRAVKAGRVIGVALENMDFKAQEKCDENENNKCGQILVFVNLSDYKGSPVEVVMNEYNKVVNGLEVDGRTGVEAASDSLSPQAFYYGFATNEKIDKEESIINFLKNLNSDQFSEIFSDRVSSKEVLSAKIFTDTLYAKNIKADEIEGLRFIVAQELSKASSSESASNSAVINKKDSLTPTPTNSIIEKIFSTLTVNGIAQFLGETVFKGDVFFMGRVSFDKDSAGYAVIKKGSDQVYIKFEKEYKETPIVVASISYDFDEDGKSDDEKNKQSELEQKILSKNLNYIVTRKTKKGFIIKLKEVAEEDINFSWSAIFIKDVATFESKQLQPFVSPTNSPAKSVSDITPTLESVLPTTEVSDASTSAQTP